MESPYIGKAKVFNRFHVSKFRDALLLLNKIDDIISTVNTLANPYISKH